MKGYLGLLTLLALLLQPLPAGACGPESDCQLGERSYRIYLPEGLMPGAGALVFAHGYKGSAKGIMRNEALKALAGELGVALIAAQSLGDDWSIPGVPSAGAAVESDELGYFDALATDAVRRFALDRDRIVVAGFSAGGMMVWNLICHRGDGFAGFIPMAGTFWRPTPERCDSPPAQIVHLHGDSDRIVPLAGRRVADSLQGDLLQVLEIYARYGGYGPPLLRRSGQLTCEERRNPEGKILDFCLFAGGHEFRTENLRRAWQRLEAAGAL